MNKELTTSNDLEDVAVNVKFKLAALWTSFMFLYIYVDYFHLYMPGTLEDLLAGKYLNLIFLGCFLCLLCFL